MILPFFSQINTVNLAKVEAKNRIETSEQRLLQFLMKNYEKSVRPVRNPSHTVTVKLGMTMTNIFEMVLNLLKRYYIY